MDHTDLSARLRASAGRIYTVTVGDLDLLMYEARRAGAKPLSVRQGSPLLDAIRDHMLAAATELDAMGVAS